MELWNVLFSIANYKEAKVSQPDADTIVCDNVKGQPLRITFKRKIDHWDVGTQVSANKLDEPQPNGVFLLTDCEADEARQEFWLKLAQQAFLATQKCHDARRNWAIAVLSKSKPKTKQKARR